MHSSHKLSLFLVLLLGIEIPCRSIEWSDIWEYTKTGLIVFSAAACTYMLFARKTIKDGRRKTDVIQ